MNQEITDEIVEEDVSISLKRKLRGIRIVLWVVYIISLLGAFFKFQLAFNAFIQLLFGKFLYQLSFNRFLFFFIWMGFVGIILFLNFKKPLLSFILLAVILFFDVFYLTIGFFVSGGTPIAIVLLLRVIIFILCIRGIYLSNSLKSSDD